MNTEIEWDKIVEPAKSPRERKIENLTNTITRSLIVGGLIFIFGVVCLFFIAYNLSPSGHGLDGNIGKIATLTFIVCTAISIFFFSKAHKAWDEKNSCNNYLPQKHVE